MIKKYSVFFGSIAALVVFLGSLLAKVSFQTLIIRAVLTFFGFYLLGIFLGVITIEALLESQVQKMDRVRNARKELEATEKPPEEVATES